LISVRHARRNLATLRWRRHSRLGQRSPADFENSTLSDPESGLAASRLASPDQIMFTAPTASALA
jgi:hypothetical protein